MFHLEHSVGGVPRDEFQSPAPAVSLRLLHFPCSQMKRFFRHFRLALWRAFQHDAFAVAKAAAFSAILTLFPAILVLASVLSISHKTKALLREVSHALGRILPEGTSDAVTQYFTGSKPVPLKLLLIIS